MIPTDPDNTLTPAARAWADYVPAWMLYVYDKRAFLTFDGWLVAYAAVTTLAQGARVEGIFDRLTRADTPTPTSDT